MTPLHFLWPVAGGLLIGLSTGLYLLLNGRAAGISSLTSRAVGLYGRFDPAAILFLLGVIGGAGLASTLVRAPQILLSGSTWTLLVAGVLVGFGTRLGSGCTSGHGICGMARLSPRSIAATLIFMGVAMLTTFLHRHVFGGI